MIAADEASIEDAANEFRQLGARVDAVCVDLATRDGTDHAMSLLDGRSVDALLANAGHGLGHGSIAGFMPGTFQAVYNASKAFIDSFAIALRHELKDTGVTVTCLMPGVTTRNSSSAPN